MAGCWRAAVGSSLEVVEYGMFTLFLHVGDVRERSGLLVGSKRTDYDN